MTLREFIPREHGAWAMWIVPMLSAALVARFSIAFFLLLICFALLYVVHHPIVLMARRKSIVDSRDMKKIALVAMIAVAAGLCLVVLYGRVWLLAFGAVEAAIFLSSIKSFLERDQRSLLNELTVVAALTLSGPASYYAITGLLNTLALLLYVLNFLFFGSSVFYVKTRIEFLKMKGVRKGEAKTAFVMMLAYHTLLIALIVSAAIAGMVSPWILLAFVPMLFQVTVGTLSKATKMNFKRLGFALVAQSAVFLVVIAVFLG